jgi:ABC-type nitrate/sulfonate/bicarbonate transport system substrate-binding protein
VGLTIADVSVEKSNSAVFEEALRSKQVDIAFTAEPWITRMLAAGDMVLLSGLERYSGGMQAASLVFSGRMVKNTDVSQRFVLACLKAVRQYAQGPTPRNVEILSVFTELEPDLVAKMCWAYAPTDGKMDPEPIRGFQVWLREQGLIDRVVEPQEYMDTRFVEAAVRTLDGRGE